MALQSDRKTPISEEKNGPLEGLKWNNWIFKEGIVPLYLLFLRHLMKLHGTGGYRFWPAPPSELKNPDHASLTISTEFWKKVGKSLYDLYPQAPPPLLTPRKSQSQATENLSIKRVIFDFLSPGQSKFIVPLLMQLGITNIVTLPPTIMKGLTGATTDEVSLLSVTPAYVHDILRNPTRCKLLQDHWKKDPGNLARNTSMLLSFLLQDTSEDCLTGCSLLPLDGGSWGTFSRKSTSQIQYFTSRTPLERSILEITDGRLVSKDLECNVINGLLEKMNISLLSFDHIPSLCRLVESKDPEYRKTWLANVWEYFTFCVEKDPAYMDYYLKSIESLPVYCGSVVGKPGSLRFLTPLSFASGSPPAIIDPNIPPSEKGKSALFQALNGLILVNRSTFPKTGLIAESLSWPQGVRRLIKSIGSLPSTIHTAHSLSQIFSGMPAEGVEALSNLILPHISLLLNEDYSLVGTLKQLPIWPVLSSSFQSAEKLKLAPHTSLTLTRMIDQTTFLRPDLASKHRDELQKLGVPQLSYLDFLNNEVGLARGYLPDKKIGEYRKFTEIVYRVKPGIFQSYNLAVNGDLCFCLPITLYDSSVHLFQAAFRDQEGSRFLHKELVGSAIWKAFLIQNISGPTYIECARSIERRNNRTLPDDQLESDSCTVFNHLCWDYQEMHSWPVSAWESLSNIRFAPAQEAITSSGHSQLRSNQGKIFRQRNRLIALSEAVDPKFEGISWSQKPVLPVRMGPLALGKITSNKPMITPTTVLGHLEFLASHREIITKAELPPRISEIKKAYEYLEEKVPAYAIPESVPIWLNVENEDLVGMTPETFRNSWSCTRDLCLNSNYDSGEIKRVRSFLGRFHQLLVHARVRRIIPPPSIPEPGKTQSPILEGLLNLREQKALFDVTITAPPQTFKAHKVVLASVSEYWKGMFTSNCRESSTAEISLQDDPSTVKVLLDYIYTNKFIKPPREDDVTRQLENLLDQLEKSEKWLLPSFQHSMENYLSDPHWIRPETVKPILRSAKMYKADRLADVCRKYIENNRVIVERESPNEE
ncbi:unnamed protein product [Tuber melanosporum]|uniref:(Perigord truffle) hypothetical protein n=1 Tax=Tuber melanosporum (strain Mel28) TaxID=656061 RepID=D5GLQ1_TUBMM|nr:uncharacterized protein GSTUM_00010311001 [Tuber melanosporum]CAZ85444.1 unnamed protein product [Tuber melanosporum]